MKNYGRMRGNNRPPEIEMHSKSVFVATNITPYEEEIDGRTLSGFEYDYKEYTMEEYLVIQNEKISSLEEELAAAKVLLGVDE